MRSQSMSVQYNHPPQYDHYIANNLWHVAHPPDKVSIDYREYPTELSDTLCHHSKLWSLPMLDEESFPF